MQNQKNSEHGAFTSLIRYDHDFMECGSIHNLLNADKDAVYIVHPIQKHACCMPLLFEYSRTSPGNPEFKGEKFRQSAAYWWGENNIIPPLKLFSVQNAHVFGGRIQVREPYGFHESGQLTLRQDYSLFEGSVGIMDGMTSLPSDLLTPIEHDQYQLTCDKRPEFLEGDYYLIGSIHSHFGHFMLEGVTRLWAMTLIPADVLERLKFVIYEPEIPPYAMKGLELLGIKREQLVFCPPHAVFNRLFVPTPAYKSHWWARLEQIHTWDRIAEKAIQTCTHSYPDRIFFTRRNIRERQLSNINDVEKAFERAGYTIVTPETLPFEDQICMSYHAKSLAGCVGSAMYLAAFQKKAETPAIIIAPRSFYLKDDTLISDRKGHGLVVALGTDTNATPERNWSIEIASVTAAISFALN